MRQSTIIREQRSIFINWLCCQHTNRNGHGARLIDAAKALAQREGLARIGLDTWEFNTKAQRFFHNRADLLINECGWRREWLLRILKP